MKLSFDHLVSFMNRPEEAIEPLTQWGIQAVMGGRHQSWGTYNALTYFGLSYIEFLGIEWTEIAEKQNDNRLVTQIVKRLANEQQEGPARIAIRTDDIEQLAARLKQAGYSLYGPFPGERVRADGEIIKWSLLFPEIDAETMPLPFFIQWEKSDQERLGEIEPQQLIFESVGIVVKNLDQTISIWSELLQLPPSEVFIDHELHACCRRLKLAGTELVFCTPEGKGIADRVLQQKGETPFLIQLSGMNQTGFVELLNGYWRFYS